MADALDMRGRVCIVTGANSGIGRAAALALARRNATVIMACRSAGRGQAALAEVRAQSGNEAVELMLVDLSSQRAIREFVREFQARYARLHVLINNAANFDHTLKKPVLTEDGVETIFATNHLGPFLMTNLLLDTLKASAPSRVINVASKGLLAFPFLTIEFDNLNGERKFSATHGYYHSKLAQVMFTLDLARRLEGTGVAVNCIRVTNVALDRDRLTHLPAILRWAYALKRKMALTPEQMAETYVHLAASPQVEGLTGGYWDENRRQVRAYRNAYAQTVWRRLWEVSTTLTRLEPESQAGARPASAIH